MPRPLPRSYRRQLEAEDAAKIDRIVGEADKLEPVSVAGGAAPADRLRGIPAIGRGCSGAIRGSNPVGALLGRERQRQR